MKVDERLKWRWFVLGPMFLSAVGCADYRWVYNYDEAVTKAKEEDRTLFIYYRHWLDANSTRMGEDVLARPDVMSRFKETVNCELEQAWGPNREAMAKYGVKTTPAFVFVKPDGTHSAKAGVMNKERFLRFVDSVLGGSTTKTSPAKKRPAAP